MSRLFRLRSSEGVTHVHVSTSIVQLSPSPRLIQCYMVHPEYSFLATFWYHGSLHTCTECSQRLGGPKVPCFQPTKKRNGEKEKWSLDAGHAPSYRNSTSAFLWGFLLFFLASTSSPLAPPIGCVVFVDPIGNCDLPGMHTKSAGGKYGYPIATAAVLGYTN